MATLPFVPLSVWDQVQATGATPAQVVVRLGTDGSVKYRVSLEPKETKVHISSIDLDVGDAVGKVLIEDALVSLQKVKGAAAGGTVAMSAELDFRPTPAQFHFDVEATKLDLRKLPERWDINKMLRGKLSGKADVRLSVKDGKPDIRGSGKGRIDEVFFGAIDLELTTDKGRLRFRPKLPPLGSMLMGGALVLAAPPPRRAEFAETPSGLASRVAGGVAGAARFAAGLAGRGLDAISRVERATRPGAETTYLNANFNLDDADLAELAKRFGATLPAGIAGRVTARVAARIPLNNAADTRAYQATIDASSKRLELAGLALEDVKAKAAYADGAVRIEGLTARVPGRGVSGRVSGSARAGLFPPGDLSLSLDLDRVPLSALEKRAEGVVSGKLSAAAPLNSSSDPAAWRGLGRLSGEGLAFDGNRLGDLTADVVAARGTLLLSDARAEALGGVATGTLGLSLRPPYRYSADLRARGIDLSRLVPGLAGSADAEGKAEGVPGGAATGSGSVSSPSFRYAGFQGGPLSARWGLAGGKLSLSGIEGKLEGGTVTGSAAVPGEMRLKLAGVSARSLARYVPGVSGTLDADLRAVLDPALKELDADLSGSRLRVGRAPVQNLKASARMSGGRLAYSARADGLGGRATLQGKWPPPPMGSTGQSHGRLRLERLRLGSLARTLGGERSGLRGLLSLDLPYRHEGPNGEPTGTGRFEIRDLSLGGGELADSILGEVRLRGGAFVLREATGTLAGGLLRVRGGFRLLDPERSW
ncbi:MAG: hypothetical protein K2X91_09480, partial [Thermoleophilia bacterium]|nr:hypothetical protein [Thermoleophilia bacterium]